MTNDSTKKTLGVALGVCLVCSFLVSLTAVGLNKRQQENIKAGIISNILTAAGLPQDYPDRIGFYENNIRPVVLDLTDMSVVSAESSGVDVQSFNVQSVLADRDLTVTIPPAEDIASISIKPRHMVVYHVYMDSLFEKLILPVYGKGLWSTLYGFITLERDITTVGGITFYQHGETPGLGGEIDNRDWRASWKGKQAFDSGGSLILRVIKGQVSPSDPAYTHTVNGLTGATLTTRGVDATVRYWLGPDGYGPYLDKLRGKPAYE